MKKVAFLCLPGLENFVKPIAEKMRSRYETKLVVDNSLYEGFKAAQWADIIWLEWANELASKLTADTQFAPFFKEKQVIVRYHSYELFHGTPALINWSLVDDVIFVAEHVKILAAKDIFPDVRIHHIPNGLDYNLFGYDGKLNEKENTRQIVLLGHLSHKKGLMLLAHCFHYLQEHTPITYHLHIVGGWQEKRYDYYLTHIFDEMNLASQVTFHNYVEDVRGFLQDKSHIICTSPWESQNLGVMEGMLCGLKPAVHNFPGSYDIYRSDHIWTTIKEFSDIVNSDDWDPVAYRAWVMENYAMEKTLEEINSVFEMGRKSTKESPEP